MASSGTAAVRDNQSCIVEGVNNLVKSGMLLPDSDIWQLARVEVSKPRGEVLAVRIALEERVRNQRILVRSSDVRMSSGET